MSAVGTAHIIYVVLTATAIGMVFCNVVHKWLQYKLSLWLLQLIQLL
jgi:hypothetical protein